MPALFNEEEVIGQVDKVGHHLSLAFHLHMTLLSEEASILDMGCGMIRYDMDVRHGVWIMDIK